MLILELCGMREQGDGLEEGRAYHGVAQKKCDNFFEKNIHL